MYEGHLELLREIRTTMIMSQEASWMTPEEKATLEQNQLLIREVIQIVKYISPEKQEKEI